MKNIELNALLFYYNRYIKTKIRKCHDKVYTNFIGLHVPKDDIESDLFTVFSTYSLLVYNKTVNKQMTDHLDENLFEDW